MVAVASAQPPSRDWDDTSPTGLSELAAVLRETGVLLRTLRGRWTAGQLAGVDVLVVSDPPAADRDSRELRAVERWVRAGGQLALLGGTAGGALAAHFRLDSAFSGSPPSARKAFGKGQVLATGGERMANGSIDRGDNRLLAANWFRGLLGVPKPAPVRLIFDTDMGNDIDDALTLAMLHAMESRGEAKILAVTITKDNPFAAPFVDLVNHFYRRPAVPIGIVRGGKTPEDGKYIRPVVERASYARAIRRSSDAPDAVAVLRNVLTGEADHSVALVQVGFSTNLARLLETPGGPDLVARKVRLICAMAGAFPTGRREYNVYTDIAAARKLFASSPVPIVFSGFEIGEAIRYPAASIEKDFAYVDHHPVAEAYRLYMKMPYDRQTWDLTAALYAVHPDAGFFSLSPPGRVTVDDEGKTVFAADPAGKHRYLIVPAGQGDRILREMLRLAPRPPG